MALTNAWPVNSGVAAAIDQRMALTGVFLTPGVVPYSKPSDSAPMPSIVYAGSTMTPQLRDFTVVSARATSNGFPTDGFSAYRNVGTTGVPAVPTAPASGSRIDTLVTRSNDTLQADGSTTTVILIRSGTATTGTPVPPTLQAGDTEIAQILVPAAVTALNASGVVITHTYQAASVVGGMRFVRNATERAAILTSTTYPADIGQEIYQQDTGYHYEARMNAAGSALKAYRLSQGFAHFSRTGTFSIANSAVNSVGSSNVLASDSVNGDFARVTDTVNGVINLDEGVYTVSFTVYLGTRLNNQRGFVEVDDGTGTTAVIARSASRDDDKLSVTALIAAPEAGRTINMNCYQATGASNTGTSDLYITRHAA